MVSPVSQIVAVSLFTVLYIGYLLQRAKESRLDLHDFLLLSTIAVIPFVFIVFLPLAYALAELVGVAFPFVLLFGLLFVFAFLCIHRLLVKVNKLALSNIQLVQEIGLLEARLQELIKKEQGG